MRTLWFTIALLAAAFSGCVATDADSDGDGVMDSIETEQGTDPMDPTSFPGSEYAQVVVAVIDSGVNVYHDFYQRDTDIPDPVLASFINTEDGQPPRSITLTQEGDYDTRLQADQDIWAGIAQGELVHFKGTNVLGISFSEDDHPVLDDGSHGTGTTTSVLEANPDAIVVLVEGVASSAGEQWAASQPWIDILSESYGLYCGQPVLELVPGDSTAKNNKIAADNGKLVVGAADNTPCPANHDGTAGPPWVVGVAGSHPDEGECREPVSGNFPDFVADFTQTLSAAGTINDTSTMSGTSFATPTTAGTFSAVLQQVRAAWGHTGGITDGAMAIGPDGQRLTAGDLRESLNRTASYFDANVECVTGAAVPITPEAPWVQMGWGHVGPDAVDPAVAFLLGEADPQKPAEAVQYMETHFAYRQQVWNTVIP